MMKYDCGCRMADCIEWEGGRCRLHGIRALEKCGRCSPAYVPVRDVPVRGYKLLLPGMRAPCNPAFLYEVGRLYRLPRGSVLRMCERGFHFCRMVAVCMVCVGFDADNVLVEVEGAGLVLEAANPDPLGSNKLVASELRVLRVVPHGERMDILAREKYL